jgi:hypothetical protein
VSSAPAIPCAPRGQIHEFENRGSVDAKFRSPPPACFRPACFREIGQVLGAAAGGPPDLAAFGEVMLAWTPSRR